MPEFLEGTVDVPKVGKVKKAYILVPAGLAGAYVLYRWYQHSRAAGDGPATSDGLYSSDDLSELGLSTTGGPTTVGGNTGSTETDATRPDSIDTNSEWTNAAVERLSNAGYDPATVYAALGEFLARRALDPAEASIARAAMAAAGQPPEGRPWSVLEEAGTGTGTPAAPTGLKVTGKTSGSLTLGWDPVPGAGSYRLYRNGAQAAVSAGTSATAAGLTANSTYSFQVSAVSTTGKEGPKSATVIGMTAVPAPGATRPPMPTVPKPGGRAASSAARPRYRSARITRRGQTLSDLVAEYNRKWRTRHSWQAIWEYNLRHRPASTQRTLRQRGPHQVRIGSSFWFPI